MKKLIAALATVVSAVSLAGLAGATVIRQDNGNTWTVGKGDVQSLFGWNAKTTDQNFEKVTFTYEKKTHADVVCDYTVSYDEAYDVEVGGVKNLHTVTKYVKHTLARSYNDSSLTTMTRVFQYETKKNVQGNVVGAVLSPGASSTTVDISRACDESIDLTAIAAGIVPEIEGATITNVVQQGTVKATEIGHIITETIYATAPIVSGAKVASTTSTSATASLWTSQEKWPQDPATTLAP